MSDIPDIEYLMRLRGRMFYHDEEKDGWIALDNNKIVNVVLVKRHISPLSHTVSTGGKSDSNDDECPPSSLSGLVYEYYIQGRNVIDGNIIHECIVDDGLLYVEAGATFHYWVTNDGKRFGIKFQSIANSVAFAKAVRTVLENVAKDYFKQKEAKCLVEFDRNSKKYPRVRFYSVHQCYSYPQEYANASEMLNKRSDIQSGGIFTIPMPEDFVSSCPIHSTTAPDIPSALNAARLNEEDGVERNYLTCKPGYRIFFTVSLCTALPLFFILYVFLFLR